MKKLLYILSFCLPLFCLGQKHYTETKVSQILRPEYGISSTLIVTKVFAKVANSQAWEVIYENEVAVSRYRYAAKVKKEEYAKAESEARRILTEKEQPIASQPVPILGTEVHER